METYGGLMVVFMLFMVVINLIFIVRVFRFFRRVPEALEEIVKKLR